VGGKLRGKARPEFSRATREKAVKSRKPASNAWNSVGKQWSAQSPRVWTKCVLIAYF
jgi:hypothetical protein